MIFYALYGLVHARSLTNFVLGLFCLAFGLIVAGALSKAGRGW